VSEADETARRAAAAMWAEDGASRGLGMSLEAVAEGYACIAMTVREDMTNGHAICHGGFIFTLADSAFAFACNATGQRAVASSCQIAYLRPAKLGERLMAEARERYREGRQGITDVTVTAADGSVVAEFRGFSRTIPGSLLEAPAPTTP
jgi:acyl-CoA thioesterase